MLGVLNIGAIIIAISCRSSEAFIKCCRHNHPWAVTFRKKSLFNAPPVAEQIISIKQSPTHQSTCFEPRCISNKAAELRLDIPANIRNLFDCCFNINVLVQSAFKRNKIAFAVVFSFFSFFLATLSQFFLSRFRAADKSKISTTKTTFVTVSRAESNASEVKTVIDKLNAVLPTLSSVIKPHQTDQSKWSPGVIIRKEHESTTTSAPKATNKFSQLLGSASSMITKNTTEESVIYRTESNNGIINATEDKKMLLKEPTPNNASLVSVSVDNTPPLKSTAVATVSLAINQTVDQFSPIFDIVDTIDSSSPIPEPLAVANEPSLTITSTRNDSEGFALAIAIGAAVASVGNFMEGIIAAVSIKFIIDSTNESASEVAEDPQSTSKPIGNMDIDFTMDSNTETV